MWRYCHSQWEEVCIFEVSKKRHLVNIISSFSITLSEYFHFSGALKNFHMLDEVYQMWAKNENESLLSIGWELPFVFIGLPCSTLGSCICLGLIVSGATQMVNNHFRMEKCKKCIFLYLPIMWVQIWFVRNVSPYHRVYIYIFCIIRPQANRKNILFPGVCAKLGWKYGMFLVKSCPGFRWHFALLLPVWWRLLCYDHRDSQVIDHEACI